MFKRPVTCVTWKYMLMVCLCSSALDSGCVGFIEVFPRDDVSKEMTSSLTCQQAWLISPATDNRSADVICFLSGTF